MKWPVSFALAALTGNDQTPTEDQSIATDYKFARSHPWQGHDIEANVFWDILERVRASQGETEAALSAVQ